LGKLVLLAYPVVLLLNWGSLVIAALILRRPCNYPAEVKGAVRHKTYSIIAIVFHSLLFLFGLSNLSGIGGGAWGPSGKDLFFICGLPFYLPAAFAIALWVMVLSRIYKKAEPGS
jgi:hypothetical protein